MVNKSYTEYTQRKAPIIYRGTTRSTVAQLQTPVGNNKFDYMDYI